MFKKIMSSIALIITTTMLLSPIKASGISDEGKIVICIDPGHQQKGDNKAEPIGPNSSVTKARVSAGTRGVGSKRWEYEVNLEASLILKELLENQGYQVVMTRETHDVNISNAERAQMANKVKADMTIRVHCDSVGNSSKTGATILVPAKNSKFTKGVVYEKSLNYAEALKEELAKKDIKVNNICERSDITGFNWSEVPVVIFEMGFMSNYCEDKKLCDKDYQTKLMECVVDSLNKVYKIDI